MQMEMLLVVLLDGRDTGVYGPGWPDSVSRWVTMATR